MIINIDDLSIFRSITSKVVRDNNFGSNYTQEILDSLRVRISFGLILNLASVTKNEW